MSNSDALQPVPARWRGHVLAPAFALAMAAFLTQLDVTAVVVVMPAIGGDLGFGLAGFAWVMDAYSLAFTGFLLVAGALADRHGRRHALLGGNILFAVASLGCGLAWDGPSLWAARVVQGAGAAFVITGAMASIAGAYPEPGGRVRAFGLMGVISGAAMALGPTLGGLVGSWLGWRWIFLANLPICLLIALAVPRLVTESRDADGRPLDLTGVALLTSALGFAIASLLQGGHMPGGLWLGLLVSAGLATGFVVRQRRQPRPMLDPDLFMRPAMIGIAALLLAMSVSYWAMLVYLPLFLRSTFALSLAQAGLAMLAATLPMLVLPPVGAGLMTRWGWRRLFATGLAIVAMGDLVLAAAAVGGGTAMGFGVVLVGMGCIGVGAGLVNPQLSGVVIALTPPAQAGMASAITVVLRQAGFAIGIAALGVAQGLDVTTEGFARAFVLAAVVAMAGCAAAMVLLREPVK
ncbi:MAG: MFS transporter [Rhizobiales bacterium]|nr:MFS transporter [Hyphomicrobiales bacterium]